MDFIFNMTGRTLRVVKFRNRQVHFRNTPIFNRHFKTVPQDSVTTISASAIKSKLRLNKVPFIDGFTCYHISECAYCYPLVKKTSSRSTDIYINKTTGYFLCENCKCTGSWDVLGRLISDNKKNGVERSAKEVASLKDGCARYDKTISLSKWADISSNNKSLHELPEEDLKNIFLEFNLEPCTQQILEKMKVVFDSEKSVLHFPLHAGQLLVGYKTFDKQSNSSTLPRNDCPGCIILSSKKKQSTAVIVSNIHDLFALASQDLSGSVVCLPYGVANLPQSILPFLECYEKIILWLGSSIGAWDSARLFAKKLNDKRCYLIRPTEKQYSATVALSKGEDIKKIIAEAQPTWHQAITTFSSLREDVFSELQNNDQVLGIKWKRYPVLNKILKGHRRGELTILTGPTGSGKTTFMSEFSLDLAMQGVNTLWGSFEIRNARLARTMLQQFSGIPLEDSLDQFDNWADEFQKLPLYFMTFHGQQSIKAVMDAVVYSSYIYDIAHVIIDNVQFMIGITDDNKYVDRFYKQDVIIQSFRTFATQNNCHVTLVIHPRKEKEAEDLTTNSIFGGAKAAQEADNILIIQDKRLTSVRGKKYLQISKNRYTGDLGIMLLDFDKGSLSYAPKKKQASAKTNPDEVPFS